MTSTADIRRVFLDYFAAREHEVVSSSPVVPAGDQTLLFTNAGMVQFKDVFLGAEKRPYTRAVSSQRCLRAGGKHNDLDQVGYTARHHTFFEMLGNFSFGDYFKREAITYAWDFLTNVVGLSKDRLWVTVFEEDDEAERIWLDEVGVAPERLARIGAKDNFWSMGDTGPCGPCTEIFYDHGPEIEGGPPGSPDEDGDRYVEIWNLVFMQFDRSADGELTPLPKQSVDTGMGLERLAAVLQGVHSNYDTDLFRRLIAAASQVTGAVDLSSPSLKVIADHIRACAFLIVDGVIPSNEGRGYVLRRIIRRAIRHGYKLGQHEKFFFRMVDPLVEQMGDAYPELAANGQRVADVLAREEERFAETLDQGMKHLEAAIEDLSGPEIPGETVFKLYDTYGFPADLTADIARERGLTVDDAGFDRAMAHQRDTARSASTFGQGPHVAADAIANLPATQFVGYDTCEIDAARIVGLLGGEGQPVDRLAKGDSGIVLLDRTPFYAESGGQVGDTGLIADGAARFEVQDTTKLANQFHAHQGKVVEGDLRVDQGVRAQVDAQRRRDIVLNHSATHLLHAALREQLGEHVQQKGSLVAPDRLRFDFSHDQPVSPAELRSIERRVNEEIRANHAGDVREMGFDEAMEAGAMAFFEDKYGDHVRVLSFGDFSIELCGGTHVSRVGDIGLFKITGESGIAAGVRRIEAVTGQGAIDYLDQQQDTVDAVASLVRARPNDVAEKVRQLMDRTRSLEKALAATQSRLSSAAGDELAEQAVQVGDLKVLSARLEGADREALRNTVDKLKDKLQRAAIVLASVENDKVVLVAGVTKDESRRLRAGDLLNHVATQVDGRGGGRPELAQGGGNDPSALPGALSSVVGWVEEQLPD